MKIKILGVCASPIKQGNTETFLQEALKAAGAIEGVETSMMLLAGKDVNDCNHCNWCFSKQEEGKFCTIKDDMNEFYPAVVENDGLLLASPVYLGRLSGRMAIFLDRLRGFIHGNYYRMKLRDKVGGALAVSRFRDGGGENTLLGINSAFPTLGMLSVRGAVGVSTLAGSGKVDPDDKHLILKDEYGLGMARWMAKKMVEMIIMAKSSQK